MSLAWRSSGLIRGILPKDPAVHHSASYEVDPGLNHLAALRQRKPALPYTRPLAKQIMNGKPPDHTGKSNLARALARPL